MSHVSTTRAAPRAAATGGIAGALWRRPWLRGSLTLAPPLLWLGVIYLASLAVMLLTSLWSVNPLTNQIDRVWTLANFEQIFTGTYLVIIGRTIVMALAVTVTTAVVAFPLAYYMARVASKRTRNVLFTLIVLPLWASYIARVYAWIVILQQGGTLDWFFARLGLPEPHLGYTNVAMWIVYSYIWLPYMVIPIFGALERIPPSYLEASADLGAHGGTTLRRVIFPMVLPGVAAGSIFTFSLTLGDFITPILVGGAGSSFIGNVIYSNIGVAGNLPFAAALAVVPIVIMIVYLVGANAAGASKEVS
jgi:putative spermidine/putrescine transport system permease protein